MADLRDPMVHFDIVKPELSLIRGDPRMAALKKKVGL
jgi:hypothetical protein